jgi:hypothetical protein
MSERDPYRRSIVKTVPIGRTENGYWAELECGHAVALFGESELARGYVNCDKCRLLDEAKRGEGPPDF